MLRLQTLGAISLEGADQPRLTSRRKELVLLAYLARRGPRPLSRAEAATLFWQDREDQRARQSLRQALLELRGVVGPALGTEADAIVLAASALEVDATCFEADLDRGDLRAAVSRWRGDFLPGAEDIGGEDLRVWLEAEREGLRRRLRSALTRLVDDAERRGAWAEGVADAAHWVEWLPLDEDGHLRLLRLLDRSGRSGEALSRYAALRTRLASMEVPPSAALEQLGRTLERSAASAPAPRAGSAALFTPELAGRDAALAELEAAWRAAGDGRSSVILIEGEAGIGKTRLCEAFLRRLERDHRPPPVFRAEAGEQSASIRLGVPSQLAAGMASAPGLGGAPAAALARLSAVAAAVRERFPAIEPVKGDARSLGHALRDALAAVSDEGPVVVLVDDLPRADAASLEAVHALLERLPRGVLLVATGRTGEDEPRLALPAESAIRRLKLQPLSRSEVEAVIGSILELSPEDRAHLAARLHDQGGGNPFYIVELVSALADEGALAPTDRGAWRLTDREGRLPLPPTVREVIARRVARLTPPGRAALEAAAVLALPFDRSLLSEVSGGSPVEIESGLEELILHRLVRDADGPGRYQFAHELVRRHVDGTVPPRRSEELSARAIGALERRVDEDEQVEAALRYHRTRAAAITSASKRRGWRRLALAGGLAGAGALGFWLWSRGGAAAPPSTIAVMPFAVSGSGELAYLRDGMATLLSSELDGAGSLRSADPRAVAGVAAQVGAPSPGVSEGARVAERIGAGTYVIGDIVEGGGRMRIKAAAYRRGQPGWRSRGRRSREPRASSSSSWTPWRPAAGRAGAGPVRAAHPGRGHRDGLAARAQGLPRRRAALPERRVPPGRPRVPAGGHRGHDVRAGLLLALGGRLVGRRLEGDRHRRRAGGPLRRPSGGAGPAAVPRLVVVPQRRRGRRRARVPARSWPWSPRTSRHGCSSGRCCSTPAPAAAIRWRRRGPRSSGCCSSSRSIPARCCTSPGSPRPSGAGPISIRSAAASSSSVRPASGPWRSRRSAPPPPRTKTVCARSSESFGPRPRGGCGTPPGTSRSRPRA